MTETEKLLRECRPYVKSQADAEAMLDGFSKRTIRASDALLARIDAALAAAKEGEP